MKSLTHSIFAGAMMGMTLTASAISFDITSLNSNGDPDAPGTWFNVGLVVNANHTATFSFGNLVALGNGTKISDIWLGTETTVGKGKNAVTTNNFFAFFTAGTGVIGGSGAFSYSIDENPNSNEGGVPWGVQLTADAQGGNDSATINPGETMTLTYSLVNSMTTEQNLIAAFNSNPQLLGIAFHVQAITGGFSEKYEAKPSPITSPIPINVPDGGATVALFGLSLLGMGGLRRWIGSRKA